MRVAVINWSARRVGGQEDYVALILPALRQAGVDVAFWHEAEGPLDRVAIVPPMGVQSFCAAQMGLEAALAALRAWEPDVLYVNTVNDVAVETALREIAPAVYFIHTYVGTCVSGKKAFSRPSPTPCDRLFGPSCLLHYLPRGCGGKSVPTMFRLFEEQSRRMRLLQTADCILTHSDHMRRELQRHGADAIVVPFPIHSQQRSVPVFPGDDCHLLFAGRMEPVKGSAVMMSALPYVGRAVDRPIRAVFAGDGSERVRLEREAAKLERTSPNVSVEFTGWVTPSQVADLLLMTDLLVVPSLWPEPLGSIGPLAAQFGVPAAAFATGGIPQWLLEGVNGHLAPADPPTAKGLADAIVQCIADPAHLSALSDGAIDVASRFTLERHLPELLTALRRVAAKVEQVPSFV